MKEAQILGAEGIEVATVLLLATHPSVFPLRSLPESNSVARISAANDRLLELICWPRPYPTNAPSKASLPVVPTI